MTSLTDYIAINHHLMTVKEMAEETGKPEASIRTILCKNNWSAISTADRIRDYITANPKAVVEDIAEKFGCTAHNIYNLAKGLGIDTLVTRKRSEATHQEPGVKPKYSLMHRAFHESAKQESGERTKTLLAEPMKRIKDNYNQSSSPYGIADELIK